MPSASLTAILEHGFEKGSGRVGRAQKLDEVVKANLAVNAHIRHNFTAYDSLYSNMKAAGPMQDVKTHARIAVYDEVKKIADSWRTGITNAEEDNLNESTSNTMTTSDETLGIFHNTPNLRATRQNPHIPGDNFVDNGDSTSLDGSRAFLKPLVSAALSRRRTRSSSIILGPNHRQLFGGVQKRRKIEPEHPTRIQPKRGMAAIDELDDLLMSMDLDEVNREGRHTGLLNRPALLKQTSHGCSREI